MKFNIFKSLTSPSNRNFSLSSALSVIKRRLRCASLSNGPQIINGQSLLQPALDRIELMLLELHQLTKFARMWQLPLEIHSAALLYYANTIQPRFSTPFGEPVKIVIYATTSTK